jgi:Mannosyltransferase (PIG-V)
VAKPVTVDKQETGTTEAESNLLGSPLGLGHFAVLAASALLSLFVAHVQISTRMIFSTCPALYWFLAVKICNRDGYWGQAILAWCLLYVVLGVVMHPNWLPWTWKQEEQSCNINWSRSIRCRLVARVLAAAAEEEAAAAQASGTVIDSGTMVVPLVRESSWHNSDAVCVGVAESVVVAAAAEDMKRIALRRCENLAGTAFATSAVVSVVEANTT